jgi:hypothetical protein
MLAGPNWNLRLCTIRWQSLSVADPERQFFMHFNSDHCLAVRKLKPSDDSFAAYGPLDLKVVTLNLCNIKLSFCLDSYLVFTKAYHFCVCLLDQTFQPLV